jgi:hypothetical protein
MNCIRVALNVVHERESRHFNGNRLNPATHIAFNGPGLKRPFVSGLERDIRSAHQAAKSWFHDTVCSMLHLRRSLFAKRPPLPHRSYA